MHRYWVHGASTFCPSQSFPYCLRFPNLINFFTFCHIFWLAGRLQRKVRRKGSCKFCPLFFNIWKWPNTNFTKFCATVFALAALHVKNMAKSDKNCKFLKSQTVRKWLTWPKMSKPRGPSNGLPPFDFIAETKKYVYDKSPEKNWGLSLPHKKKSIRRWQVVGGGR